MAIWIRNTLKHFTHSSSNVPDKTRLIHDRFQSLINIINCIHTTPSYCKRRKTAEERKAPKALQFSPKAKGNIIDIWRNITVGELAQVLQRDVNYVSDLFLGNVRDRHAVIADMKELQNAVRRSGKRIRVIAKPVEEIVEVKEKDAFRRPPPAASDLKSRPPIVTVMGHVDHGKTTLLDALRHSSVVDEEFGGITQHIGAFLVKLESGAKVTFLDTPGHAAFSAMRARGANLTDIVVLVVAADDGVMEQTVESIKMARNAKVPILVAINKIDAPKANVERTEQMLMQVGIPVERLGGDVQAVPISALKRINLDQLTEALVLQSEIMEICGDPSGPVEAVVVESRVDPHRGCLCTLVVQRGTLMRGDILVADTAIAKVRLLRDSNNRVLDRVEPGYPAEVEGWRSLPPAGSLVLEVDTEKRARQVSEFRASKKEAAKLEQDSVEIARKVEEHNKEYKAKLEMRKKLGRFRLSPEGPRKPEFAKDDDHPFLNIIIKADVDGTLEAILEVLSTYYSTKCKLDIVSYGIGGITENDVELANTFKGIIYAFNVNCPNSIQKLADESDVSIKHHNIIYRLVDDLKEDINERLPPKQVDEVIGEAKVVQQFLINDGRKKIPVAGCYCEKGMLKKKLLFRVIRNDNIIHEGTLSAMRYLKEEVETIKGGSDCGLQFKDKSIMFEEGDKIICYQHKMEIQTTDWDPGF